MGDVYGADWSMTGDGGPAWDDPDETVEVRGRNLVLLAKAMVLAALIEDPALKLSLGTAGILNSVTLLSAAAGGIAFGVIADRIGRKRALMAAVLIFSIFTALCGVAQTALQLAVFRILLGLGMGGEWATGVALVSETFPARHRGKALPLCVDQSQLINPVEIGWPVLLPANSKHIEMVVLPAHDHLQNPMELSQGIVPGDLNTAPDRRVNAD